MQFDFPVLSYFAPVLADNIPVQQDLSLAGQLQRFPLL
jgi:hypothetical protein